MMSLILDKWLRIVVQRPIFCLDLVCQNHNMDNPSHAKL